MEAPQYGKLYLIPTTLGDTEPLEVLPISIKKAIERIDYFVVENEKTARRFIKKITPSKKQESIKLSVINKYTDPLELPSFLNPCLEGHTIGVISEAGCPGVADPGADLVAIAHQKNIQVTPLVGPSSILLALMASGFNGQNFAFIGYLPIDNTVRKSAIKRYENQSKSNHQALICIETPYRNNKLFEEFCNSLSPQTKLCIACDITLLTEYISSKTIGDWKRSKIDLHKRPCIFIIQA